METVLVVEDDNAILIGIRDNLRYEGYNVLTARDGERGLKLAEERNPDLIVLDVMLPKLNGFEACKVLRKRGVDVPIIMLTARGEEVDKIMGLDLGADDYMTKPFSIRELLARINAALRRRRTEDKKLEQFAFDAVEVDFSSHTLALKGEPQEMTTREFELLRYFITSEGRVLSRGDILNRVWGSDYYGTERTVDNFINRLRQKIGDDATDPKRIITVRGVGYKFTLGEDLEQ